MSSDTVKFDFAAGGIFPAAKAGFDTASNTFEFVFPAGLRRFDIPLARVEIVTTTGQILPFVVVVNLSKGLVRIASLAIDESEVSVPSKVAGLVQNSDSPGAV